MNDFIISMEYKWTDNTVSIFKDMPFLNPTTGKNQFVRVDTRAFVPGEIEKVKDYVVDVNLPEYIFIASKWTPEVIDAYHQLIAQEAIPNEG